MSVRTDIKLRPLAAVEREHVLAVLDACGGHKARACQILQIGRRTLDMKLHGWDLHEQYRRQPGPKKSATDGAPMDTDKKGATR